MLIIFFFTFIKMKEYNYFFGIKQSMKENIYFFFTFIKIKEYNYFLA